MVSRTAYMPGIVQSMCNVIWRRRGGRMDGRTYKHTGKVECRTD